MLGRKGSRVPIFSSAALISRRSMLFLALQTAGLPRELWADSRYILIATASAVPAFEQAINGMREQIGGTDVAVADIMTQTGRAVAEAHLFGRRVQAVVTLGSEALKWAQFSCSDEPIYATMILSAGNSERAARNMVASLPVDLPAPLHIDAVQELLPNVRHLAVFRNPRLPGSAELALANHAKRNNIGLQPVDVTNPSELLRAVLDFQGKVDAGLCFPDSALYNATTLPPLITASLKARVPLVGFSESFVRAGAAVGVFPDYEDVGRQIGLALRQSVRSPARPEILSIRRVRTCANVRILRLLGISREHLSGKVLLLR